MPADQMKRYNANMIAISRMELTVTENALAAANKAHSELELLLTADDLTGHLESWTLLIYVHELTTARVYRQPIQIIHRLTTMTDEHRQALGAIQRHGDRLGSVLNDYKKQWEATVQVCRKHSPPDTDLPVGMWPKKKAKGAHAPKPSDTSSKPRNLSYDEVVRRLELQAQADQDLSTLRVDLSTAQQSEQEAAQRLQQQVKRRDLQHKQGLNYQIHIESPVLNVCSC
jgi:hypothetical protein